MPFRKRESRLIIARSLQDRAIGELRDGQSDRALATIRRARKTIDDPRLAYSEGIIANHLRTSSDAEAAARAATGGSPDIAERAYARLVLRPESGGGREGRCEPTPA